MRRIFLALGCAALAACAPHTSPLHGTELQPAKTAHPFTLTDQRGRSYSLAAQRGSAVALYFGFAHCKDVCPQTLAKLGKARERADLQPGQLQVVMVTVDPKRDTPQSLAAFLRRVGVRATALTGTQAELQPVYAAYGVAVEPQKNEMGHTDFVYLIDASGRLREIFGPEMPLSAVAEDFRTVAG